jgi:hypothetical protein
MKEFIRGKKIAFLSMIALAALPTCMVVQYIFLININIQISLYIF